jgi:hypothetical protein
MKRDRWSGIARFSNGQIGNLFFSAGNRYRLNRAETCALVFALTPLSNVIKRREILMTCSELQDLAILQNFSTTDLATHKFHSISTADSSPEMEHRQIEAVSRSADRNLS